MCKINLKLTERLKNSNWVLLTLAGYYYVIITSLFFANFSVKKPKMLAFSTVCFKLKLNIVSSRLAFEP